MSGFYQFLRTPSQLCEILSSGGEGVFFRRLGLSLDVSPYAVVR
jgi:hypothetical protein